MRKSAHHANLVKRMQETESGRLYWFAPMTGYENEAKKCTLARIDELQTLLAVCMIVFPTCRRYWFK